jgi:DNA-binding transcriptional regulator YiaG
MSNHDGRSAARGPGHHEGDSPWPVDLGRIDRGPDPDLAPSVTVAPKQDVLPQMTAAEFRTALANLHLTQRDYAARIRTNERTVRRWAAGDQVIPGWAVVILEFMAELQRHGIAFVD